MRIIPILLLISLNSWSAPQRQLLSMAVGELRGHVVTSREVNANFFVETVLFGRKDKKVAEFYEIKSPKFAKEVTAVIMEWVVFKESEGFVVANVSDKETQEALVRVRGAAKSLSAWRKLEFSPAELKTLVARKLRAKKFVRFKVDSSVVPITDDEAKEYFEENRLKFGNLPYKNFAENIKSFLGRKQIDRRLKDWFDVLQNKYKVRNYLSEIE